MSSFAAMPATESGAGPRRHPTRWWAAQWLMLALTAAVLLALFELTDIDRQLTQVFYDPAARAFPLRQHWFFDAVLHRGAKQASYLLVVACLWLCWRGWRGMLSWLLPRNALLAALGMLLMLRDKAKASGRAVTLANCRGAVKQVLDIANFGKLFAIV